MEHLVCSCENGGMPEPRKAKNGFIVICINCHEKTPPFSSAPEAVIEWKKMQAINQFISTDEEFLYHPKKTLRINRINKQPLDCNTSFIKLTTKGMILISRGLVKELKGEIAKCYYLIGQKKPNILIISLYTPREREEILNYIKNETAPNSLKESMLQKAESLYTSYVHKIPNPFNVLFLSAIKLLFKKTFGLTHFQRQYLKYTIHPIRKYIEIDLTPLYQYQKEMSPLGKPKLPDIK